MFANSQQDISPFFPGLVALVEKHLYLKTDGPKILDILAYAPLVDAEGE